MTLSPKNTVETIAAGLLAARWYLLGLAIVLGAGAFLLKDDVSFDNSIEGMFSADDHRLVDYQRLKNIFGGAEIVLAVYEDPDLFAADGSGLQTLRRRSSELASVPGIIGVLSLSEINEALKKIYALGNLLSGQETAEPIINEEDPVAREFLETFAGYTHGRDGKTVAIVCLLQRLETLQIPRSETIATLRQLTNQWSGAQITGEPVLLVDGFRFIERDGQRLNRVCLGLMALVILVCFRSIRWFLIPLAVIQLSMWLTLATLALLGWKLTMVSSMLAAILAVISVATVVHIIVRFREARLQPECDRASAIAQVVAALFMPITWTCLTTAAGFLALTIADVEPVADFGWMMVLGSLFVWVSVFLLVPGLALLGNLDSDPQATWGDRWLGSALQVSSGYINSHAVPIGVAVVLMFMAVGSGITRLHVETDFTKNFREDSQIIRAYTFVEKNLGGAGVLDVVIRAPDRLNRQFLETIDRLQNDLRHLTLASSRDRTPALTHVVSFADADRIVRTRPVLAMLTPEIRFRAMAEVMPGFASQMRTTEPDRNGNHWFRIMLRTCQQKSAEEQTELIARVQETVSGYFPDTAGDSPPRTMTTGFFVLLSSLVESVLDDQTKTFLVACLFIGIVILVAFRSPVLVLIGLIPNMLPIVGLLGMLGWLNIPLNMGAAMIAAVSMGLSIDGTIHYLTSYRLNRRAGLPVARSIEYVQFRTGRAVIYATLALVLGFGSLCFSEFIPTVFFGGLVGLSMLGGLLGNLIVLPVLLSLFDRRNDRRHQADGTPQQRRFTDEPATSGTSPMVPSVTTGLPSVNSEKPLP